MEVDHWDNQGFTENRTFGGPSYVMKYRTRSEILE